MVFIFGFGCVGTPTSILFITACAMPSNRRRGKSVVFDSLPSFVTTDGDPVGYSRSKTRFSEKFSREAVREIVLVLIGLALVVWLFFGGEGPPSSNLSPLGLGNRQLVSSDTPFIVPAHYGSAGAAHDGVKKAPGDKQGMTTLDSTGAKRASNVIVQYDQKKSPELVLVTLIDDNKHPRDYIEKIIENRVEYAQSHGYGVLIKFANDYLRFIEESHNHQPTWARVALAMEAEVSFPRAEWFWYLADDALIMESGFDPLNDLLDPAQLEPRMKRQVPVMRYDNTHIRTYRNNRVQDVSYVLTQDGQMINTDTFFFRNNGASRALLELWAEPLYRKFRRFSSERDALGHMMQWHTQFLVRTAVVEPHYLGSLVVPDGSEDSVWNEVSYKQGDIVAIVSCDYTTEVCKRDFQKKWNERKRPQNAIQQPKEGIQGAKNQVQNQVQVEAQEKAQVKAEKQAAENNV